MARRRQAVLKAKNKLPAIFFNFISFKRNWLFLVTVNLLKVLRILALFDACVANCGSWSVLIFLNGLLVFCMLLVGAAPIANTFCKFYKICCHLDAKYAVRRIAIFIKPKFLTVGNVQHSRSGSIVRSSITASRAVDPGSNPGRSTINVWSIMESVHV